MIATRGGTFMMLPPYLANYQPHSQVCWYVWWPERVVPDPTPTPLCRAIPCSGTPRTRRTLSDVVKEQEASACAASASLLWQTETGGFEWCLMHQQSVYPKTTICVVQGSGTSDAVIKRPIQQRSLSSIGLLQNRNSLRHGVGQAFCARCLA